MGGGDKCLLPLAGKPILAYVIERLKPQVAELIISANGHPARFSAFGLRVVEDRLGFYSGPLAGILAGLEWARTNRPESRFAITAAGDTPFLPTDLVSRLCSASGEAAPDLAVARSSEGMHPVFGLWPVTLAPDLEVSLISGDRKVSEWVVAPGKEGNVSAGGNRRPDDRSLFQYQPATRSGCGRSVSPDKRRLIRESGSNPALCLE
jgi:molybdenum cofactor guanylyltransferase